MTLSWSEIERLKRDYNLLGVPISASSHVVRQAYRRMVRRWHPDLYPNGSRDQEDATQMMKLVNDAYANIQHAPLRYHLESYPEVKETRAWQQRSYHRAEDPWPRCEDLPVTDRMEYWVRFSCGGVFGFFMSSWTIVLLSRHLVLALLICGAISFTCAFSAARQGDSFWHKALGTSWRWWF